MMEPLKRKTKDLTKEEKKKRRVEGGCFIA
jgi:hypothetical protein